MGISSLVGEGLVVVAFRVVGGRAVGLDRGCGHRPAGLAGSEAHGMEQE